MVFRPREVSRWIRTPFFIQIHAFRPQIHHSGSPKHKKIGLGFRVWEGARGGPEEAGIEKVDRRLQPNAKVPFIFSILRGVFEGRYHELSIFTANNHAR